MARLLVVHHSPTTGVQALTDAVVAGAHDDQVDGVEVRVVPALEARADDVLAADGYLLGTTANFGYMSGALKHFFDTIFLEAGARWPRTARRRGSGRQAAVRSRVHGRYVTRPERRLGPLHRRSPPVGAGRRGAGEVVGEVGPGRRAWRTSSAAPWPPLPAVRVAGGAQAVVPGSGRGVRRPRRPLRRAPILEARPTSVIASGSSRSVSGEPTRDPAPTTQSRSTTDRSMHAPRSTTVPSKSTSSRTTAPSSTTVLRPDHAADHGAVHQRTRAEEAVGHLRPARTGRRPLEVVAEDRPVRVTEHAEVVGQRVAVGREVLVRLAQVLPVAADRVGDDLAALDQARGSRWSP